MPTIDLHSALTRRLDELAGDGRAVHSYEQLELGCGITAVLLYHVNFDVDRGPDRYTVLIYGRLPGKRQPDLLQEFSVNRLPDAFNTSIPTC